MKIFNSLINISIFLSFSMILTANASYAIRCSRDTAATDCANVTCQHGQQPGCSGDHNCVCKRANQD